MPTNEARSYGPLYPHYNNIYRVFATVIAMTRFTDNDFCLYMQSVEFTGFFFEVLCLNVSRKTIIINA